MYLSKIELTPAIAEQSQLGLLLKGHSYGMHRLLWDLFPKGERFLFREEVAREQGGIDRNMPIYYVLSTAPPMDNSPLFKVDSKLFNPQLNAEDRLAFRLRANPVVKRKVEGNNQSSRHDVVMDAQKHWLKAECERRGLSSTGVKRELKKRLVNHKDFSGATAKEKLDAELKLRMDTAANNWLVQRGDKHGYRIIDGDNGPLLQSTGYRWHALPEKARTAGFASVDYEGVLEVTDPAAFCAMLKTGLGPCKAFGCGLILIRRIT